MKISLQDRELARELAELFNLNEQAMKMLGVVLSSHRQLPADEKPAGPTPTCLDRDPNYLRRCVLDPGHPGHHGASDGYVWI